MESETARLESSTHEDRVPGVGSRPCEGRVSAKKSAHPRVKSALHGSATARETKIAGDGRARAGTKTLDEWATGDQRTTTGRTKRKEWYDDGPHEDEKPT